MTKWTSRGLLTVLVAALALVAAGCGSSQSAEEKWANDVCTPIASWQKQINQVVNAAKSAVTSPQAGTLDTLKSEAKKAVTATDQMKSDLKGLPPAPGANGQAARETVTTFASQMSQIVDTLQSSVSSLSSSLSASEAVAALKNAAAQISPLLTQAKSTVSSLQQTSSKLKSGFQDAGSCKDLRGS
jgi:uncharacterized phage infection (PIP) family protein YhgE